MKINNIQRTDLKRYYKLVFNCSICNEMYGTDKNKGKKEYSHICPICIDKILKNNKKTNRRKNG